MVTYGPSLSVPMLPSGYIGVVLYKYIGYICYVFTLMNHIKYLTYMYNLLPQNHEGNV